MAERAHVVRAGATAAGDIYIHLRSRDNSWPNERWYTVPADHGGPILAAALTALSSNMPVEAWLTDLAEYSKIDRLVVLRE